MILRIKVDKKQLDEMGKDLVKNFLNTTRNNLIDEFVKPTGRPGNFPLVFHGRLLQSIKIMKTSATLRYRGKYAPYIEYGAHPRFMPPREKIKTWVRVKLGIRGKKVDRVAFFVGRKIKKKGTPRFEPMLHALQKTFDDPKAVKRK